MLILIHPSHSVDACSLVKSLNYAHVKSKKTDENDLKLNEIKA